MSSMATLTTACLRYPGTMPRKSGSACSVCRPEPYTPRSSSKNAAWKSVAPRAKSQAHRRALEAAPAAGEAAKKVCPIRKSLSIAYMAISDLLPMVAGGGTTQSPYMLPSAKWAAPVELYRASK
eukprot:3200235-Prymnesium_polylepis.1